MLIIQKLHFEILIDKHKFFLSLIDIQDTKDDQPSLPSGNS